MRQLIFRMTAPQVAIFQHNSLIRVLKTITSLFFHEFVLELGGLSPHLNRKYSMHLGQWEKVDEFLETQFAKGGDFKLIIRTGETDDRESFHKQTRETFPLLASRGCVYFEMSNSIEKFWR